MWCQDKFGLVYQTRHEHKRNKASARTFTKSWSET